MFIGQKQTGETKARMVAGGNTQCGHVTKEESSSSTVFTEAVLLTSIVDARKGKTSLLLTSQMCLSRLRWMTLRIVLLFGSQE